MDDDCHYVYRHRRLDTNEIFYIGIGKTKGFKRAYSKINRSEWWKRIITKTDYKVEILSKNLSSKDAKELEVFLISVYGRKDLGLGKLVNMTNGGDGVVGGIITEKNRKLISERNKGEKNYMFGKTHTPEAREKISKRHKGVKFSEERKKEISKRVRENPLLFTEEYRLKLSKASSGKNNGMFGRTYGSNPRAKKVINTETGKIYSCVKEAAEDINIKFSTLYSYLTGVHLNKTKLKFYEIQIIQNWWLCEGLFSWFEE